MKIFILKIQASVLFFLASGILSAQQSYTFTNASATGRLGPNQTQVSNAYALTNLAGNVSVTTTGIQTWTVPTSGVYRVTALGSSSGRNSNAARLPGLGAVIQGEFNLTAGDVLQILVGQLGQDHPSYAAGGGGGSFVTRPPHNTINSILVIAGGGGAPSGDFSGISATTGTCGTFDAVNNSGPAQCAGDGGISFTGNSGGGGGGFFTDGQNNTTVAQGGKSYINGGAGAVSTSNLPVGGFGGGGGQNGATGSTYAASGGGGFSGGNGGNRSPVRAGGGGGGSYNNGSNQVNAIATATGHGKVVIEQLCSITLSVNGVASNSTICTGNSLTLTTNAISGYLWSTNSTAPSITVAPTTTTVYSLTATSPSNCVSSAQVTITVNSAVPVLTITNSAGTASICLGTQATLTANGALSYTWSPAITNGVGFVPQNTTTYTVQGQNGCGITTAVETITVAPLPVNAISTSPTICALSSVTLTTGGANTYTWSTNQQGINVVAAPTITTVYTVTGQVGACVGTATVGVAVNPNPTISVSASTTDICAGDIITLNVSGAQTYTWTQTFLSGTSPTVSPATTTLYAVSGTNQHTCSSTGGVLILVKPLPVINVSASRTLVCSGLPSTLTANGNSSTYSWAHGGTASSSTVYPAVSSVYTITGSDAFCSNTKTVGVSVFSPSFVVTPDTAICNGGMVVLGATGAVSYTWINQQAGQYIQVNPTVTSTYSVIANVLSPNNYVTCPLIKTVTVGIYPNPTITATGERSQICRGEKVTLSAQGGQIYNWSNSTSGQTISVSPNSETRYIVTGEDAFGCVNSGTVLVRVSVCPGMNENEQAHHVSIYPNPNSGIFVVDILEEHLGTLTNILGESILTTRFVTGKNTVNLDAQPAGIYFLILSNVRGIQESYRIIKN